MSLVEIKDFNPFIDNKPFFDQPLKNKQEPYEKFIKISRNDGYITRNLLGYLYHQKYYKLIGKMSQGKPMRAFLNKIICRKIRGRRWCNNIILTNCNGTI